MIDVTDKSLSLSQRIEVASHFKAGFELDADDVRFVHKSLSELRKQAIVSVSAEEIYYNRKLKSLGLSHGKRLQTLQMSLVFNAWAFMAGIMLWLT